MGDILNKYHNGNINNILTEYFSHTKIKHSPLNPRNPDGSRGNTHTEKISTKGSKKKSRSTMLLPVAIINTCISLLIRIPILIQFILGLVGGHTPPWSPINHVLHEPLLQNSSSPSLLLRPKWHPIPYSTPPTLRDPIPPAQVGKEPPKKTLRLYGGSSTISPPFSVHRGHIGPHIEADDSIMDEYEGTQLPQPAPLCTPPLPN